MRKGEKKNHKHPGGRPTKITELVLKKLEEAFAFGCSDIEACLYADISHQTLYNYQEKNPEFVERKEQLKKKPVLKAREVVVKGLEGDPDLAMKFLERKEKAEFGLRVEHTGRDGGPIETMELSEVDDDTYNRIIKRESDRLKEGGKK